MAVKIPRSLYKVMHALYVEHLTQDEAAYEVVHCSIDTLKRRNAQALDMIYKSIDAIDMTLF